MFAHNALFSNTYSQSDKEVSRDFQEIILLHDALNRLKSKSPAF